MVLWGRKKPSSRVDILTSVPLSLYPRSTCRHNSRHLSVGVLATSPKNHENSRLRNTGCRGHAEGPLGQGDAKDLGTRSQHSTLVRRREGKSLRHRSLSSTLPEIYLPKKLASRQPMLKCHSRVLESLPSSGTKDQWRPRKYSPRTRGKGTLQMHVGD